MAVPHYAYLKLKILGPQGVFTVNSNFQRSNDCDLQFSKLSESFGMQEELAELRESMDFNDLPDEPKNAPGLAFESRSNTRAHQIHPIDPTKTALVSTTLSSEQEAEVVKFLRSWWKIFAWCPADMPGVPRELVEHTQIGRAHV